MELAVYNIEGKATGKKVTLSDDVFGIEPNAHVVYLDAKLYLANQRQGTHKAKEKNEISASTRKIKKQKGTGGARAGSLKSPVFVGGGRVFGPRPRSYSFKLNKKERQLAKCSVLSDKAKSSKITVIDKFDLSSPSTKAYLAVLNNLSVSGKSLLVLPDYDKNVYFSGRNIPKVKVTTVSELSTYDILHTEKLILLEGSVQKIENALR